MALEWEDRDGGFDWVAQSGDFRARVYLSHDGSMWMLDTPGWFGRVENAAAGKAEAQRIYDEL